MTEKSAPQPVPGHTPVTLAVNDSGCLYNRAAVHQHADQLKIISPWIEDAWGDDCEAAANMRRLAACWNACEHVPIEVLEAHASGGLPWSVGDQIDQRVMHANVVKRNHELRTALDEAADALIYAGKYGAAKVAREVAAKLGGAA